MSPIYRTMTRCTVCGFSEVRTDQVLNDGVLLLAECPRCEHRWTARTESAVRPIAIRTAGSPVEVPVKVAA